MVGHPGHPRRRLISAPRSRVWRVLRWAGLAAAAPALWACTSRTLEPPKTQPNQVYAATVTEKINRDMDLLFMIDDSSSMTGMQQLLYSQLPVFIETLKSSVDGTLPSLHVGVVSSDMGALSNVTLMGCNNTGGDNGQFFVQPEGTCTSTTLMSGAEWISNDGGNNFTQPDNGTEPGMAIVFQCIALLGQNGCGFEHQLASIDRALGGDGSPPPSTNAGFLRTDAYLGIVLLTNEDDCSAPQQTSLFSLQNTSYNGINDPQGPIANYRCNGGPHGGHLCTYPDGTTHTTPPLNPPMAQAGTTETFTNCESNEADPQGLIPVGTFVSDIKGLKADPDSQILVAAITGPATPYVVQWEPGTGSTAASSELWPAVVHSCGTENPDGSGIFADPAVRITQFVHAFGSNGILESICENSYGPAMMTIANDLNALIKPKCLPSNLQVYTDANGTQYPNCSVVDNVTNGTNQTHVSLPSCSVAAQGAACWNLVTDTSGSCPAGTLALQLNNDTTNMAADGLNTTVQCATCPTGAHLTGCPCLNDGSDVTGCTM
jgi:hypothetical protein